jgi:MSHA biogenesis protein MshJ
VTALEPMVRRLTLLGQRLDALSLRERGLIFAAGVTLAYIAWQTLFMDGLNKRTQIAEQQLSEARQHLAALAEADAAASANPLNAAAARNTALRTRLASLDADLRAAASGYVAPEKMIDMLREILAGQHGLKLVSLANLPVQSLAQVRDPGPAATSTGAAGAGAAPAVEAVLDDKDPGPFLHPVEIVVEGNYGDVVSYLRALEALPWRIHWQQLELKADDSGSRVRVVIGALSLSRYWMSVT